MPEVTVKVDVKIDLAACIRAAAWLIFLIAT